MHPPQNLNNKKNLNLLFLCSIYVRQQLNFISIIKNHRFILISLSHSFNHQFKYMRTHNSCDSNLQCNPNCIVVFARTIHCADLQNQLTKIRFIWSTIFNNLIITIGTKSKKSYCNERNEMVKVKRRITKKKRKLNLRITKLT